MSSVNAVAFGLFILASCAYLTCSHWASRRVDPLRLLAELLSLVSSHRFEHALWNSACWTSVKVDPPANVTLPTWISTQSLSFSNKFRQCCCRGSLKGDVHQDRLPPALLMRPNNGSWRTLLWIGLHQTWKACQVPSLKKTSRLGSCNVPTRDAWNILVATRYASDEALILTKCERRSRSLYCIN